MEGTLALVIILILLIPIASIAAFIKSLSASARARRAEDNVTELQLRLRAMSEELRQLKAEVRAAKPGNAPAASPSASVPEYQPAESAEALLQNISAAPEPAPQPEP